MIDSKNDLKTEVGILDIQSLMPIFNFVISQEENNSLKYQKWINNLEINLEKGTQFLIFHTKIKIKNLVLSTQNWYSLPRIFKKK